jgi:hypothetical protein
MARSFEQGVLLSRSPWHPDFDKLQGDISIQEFASMFDRSAQLDLLLDLEVRQDELMLRLDELDRRVEKTLIECQSLRTLETQANARPEAA